MYAEQGFVDRIQEYMLQRWETEFSALFVSLLNV